MNILVIDDDKSCVEHLSKYLDFAGHEVDFFLSPKDALSEFKRIPEKFDLVITDYNMGEINGVKLFEEMKKLKDNIKVILMSGVMTVDSESMFFENGGREFIAKPIDVRKLNFVLGEIETEMSEALNFSQTHLLLQSELKSVPAPVIYIDQSFRYVGCNGAFEEFIGLNSHQIIGKTSLEVFPREMALKIRNINLELMARPGDSVYQDVYRSADGDEKSIEVHKSTYPLTSDDPMGVVTVIYDKTTQLKLQKIKQNEKNIDNIVKSLFENIR